MHEGIVAETKKGTHQIPNDPADMYQVEMKHKSQFIGSPTL